jgi:phage portal protein BeeE
MAGFLSNLFKRGPDRRPSDQPASASSSNMRGAHRTLVSYENVIAAEAALEHPVVFRCLNKIAQSVQSVDWYCEEDPNVPPTQRAGAASIKAINAVLTSPSGMYSPDMLRFWMALNFACYGRVPYLVGMGVSAPTGIYPLAVPTVREVLDARGHVKGYRHGLGENAKLYPVRSNAGAAHNYVSELYTPNLAGEIENGKNITPLKAIGLPSQVTRLLLQRAVDTAAGHPNNKYIITAEKTLTGPQREALKEHIETAGPGDDESGRVLFLHNTKIEVHPLDNNLSDIHSKMPMDDMTRLIAGSFGIPISLLGLGAADGAKFAGNYEESRRSFWEDTIIPGYLSPIARNLTQGLCPDGARIVFDLDSISAIGDVRAKKAKELTGVTFLTDDEKRELAGYPPLTAAQKAEIAARAPVATGNATGNENKGTEK